MMKLNNFQPKIISTVVILIGCFLISNPPSGTPYEVAHGAALIMGAAIFIASFIEFRANPRNLIRVDMLMIVALYGLVLLEFLFEQPDFNRLIKTTELQPVLFLVAIGFTGISIGRHWQFKRSYKILHEQNDVSPQSMITMYLICVGIGYFHMLLSVNFNPILLLEGMTGPRFSEPWGRGRYGGLSDLIHEIGMLLYMVPPIAGVILAKKEDYTKTQVFITRFFLIFTLFYGFCTGTRNVFAVYVISYICAYFMVSRKLTRTRMIKIGIIYTIVLLISAQLMLDFRQDGFANYASRIIGKNWQESEPFSVPDRSGLFIDYNLLTLARTQYYFPQYADFLGFEVVYWALVKPIPRAFWPGKPKGLSTSIETIREARGAEAATWSATFLGESYMGGGYMGAGLAAFIFGAMAAWWNRRFIPGSNVYQNLLYASGIFAALITMRSLFWFTTAILPTIALVVYARWFMPIRGRLLYKDASHET